jgi:amino acid transporter
MYSSTNIFFLSFLFLTFQRDFPIGIIGSLLVCIALYIGVCLVITGMVPYSLLGEEAPLAEAFKSKGLKFVSILISIGAIAGLTRALLVGLYVQVNHVHVVILIDVPEACAYLHT